MKTLCSLLLLVLLLGPIHGLDITPTIIKDSEPRKFLKFSSTDYKPINITFDHSNSNANVSGTAQPCSEYLNETIFPLVQYFFKSAIKVLPRSSKIIAKPDVCKDAVKVPGYASETGFDSDLVIFVKTTSDKIYGFDDIFVQGAACGLDETTQRPIVGVLTFGDISAGGWYAPFETERRIALTIHEIVHVLGFQEKLFPYFINPDTLQPLTDHFFNKTVNDVNTLVLNVAPLTQRVRSYFNCPTVEGVYLENQGDSMTKNSHFERRIFGNELMTAGEVFDRRISQFTLALLEGTGWFKVDYSVAEPLSYGKNEGCAFLDTKCLDPVTLKPNFKEFCSPLTERGVSWTKRGSGFCGAVDAHHVKHQVDANLIAAFDYWGNKTTVEDKYSDNCPSYFTPYGPVEVMVPHEFDCENEFAPSRMEFEYVGAGSKAFMGTLVGSRKYSVDRRGYCFKPKCVSKSDGTYELQIPFRSTGVVTCNATGSVNASDFPFENNMGGALECPDPNEFCKSILEDKFCRAGCFGNGVCSDRECKCKDGWGFHSCERKYESSRCTKDPLRTTAYGDDCICSYDNNTCQCALGLRTGDVCKQTDNNNNGNNKNNEDKNNNSSGNQPNGGSHVGLYLIVGLIVVVIAVVLIQRRKQADDLNISLVQGPRSHDISAF